MRLVKSYGEYATNTTSLEIHRLNDYDSWTLYIWIHVPQGKVVCGYESYDNAATFTKVGEEYKTVFKLTQDDTSADAIKISLNCGDIPSVDYEFRGYVEE